MSTNVQQPALNGLGDRIVAEAQDAIIYADRDGIICLWNAGAENLFGHAADDALGQSLDLIIPDELRQRHWHGWEKVIATGQTKYGQEPLAVPGLRADGTRVSLEFSITMLHDDTGELSGIAAILRDVTTRWEQNQALRKRLTTLEASQQLPSDYTTP